MARTLSLFESATSRGRVIRQGDLTQIVIDGGGALVTPTLDFRVAQRWGQAKPASGNLITDRGRFFEKLSCLISRTGTNVPTRGNAKQLEGLARQMMQAGYDLAEWALPQELKSIGRPDLEPLAPKPKAAEAAEDDEVPRSDS